MSKGEGRERRARSEVRGLPERRGPRLREDRQHGAHSINTTLTNTKLTMIYYCYYNEYYDYYYTYYHISIPLLLLITIKHIFYEY